MNRIYHYTTTTFHLGMILRSGFLQPSSAGGSSDEKPLLWFSKNAIMEPTAIKFPQMTLETYHRAVGTVRFALPFPDDRLLPWKEAYTLAGVEGREQVALQKVGIELGADPDDWYAIAGSVPLDELTLEILHGDTWIAVEEGDKS